MMAADPREGWVFALNAIWYFLDGARDPIADVDGAKTPVWSLMTALRDLGLGTVHPGLRSKRDRPMKGEEEADPKERPGRPKDAYPVTMTRCLAVFFVDKLSKALVETEGLAKGDADKLASERIAYELTRYGFPIGQQGGARRRNDTIEKAGRTVMGWREYIEGGRGHPGALAAYRRLRAKEKYQYPPGTPAATIMAEMKVMLPLALDSLLP